MRVFFQNKKNLLLLLVSVIQAIFCFLWRKFVFGYFDATASALELISIASILGAFGCRNVGQKSLAVILAIVPVIFSFYNCIVAAVDFGIAAYQVFSLVMNALVLVKVSMDREGILWTVVGMAALVLFPVLGGLHSVILVLKNLFCGAVYLIGLHDGIYSEATQQAINEGETSGDIS